MKRKINNDKRHKKTKRKMGKINYNKNKKEVQEENQAGKKIKSDDYDKKVNTYILCH